MNREEQLEREIRNGSCDIDLYLRLNTIAFLFGGILSSCRHIELYSYSIAGRVFKPIYAAVYCSALATDVENCVDFDFSGATVHYTVVAWHASETTLLLHIVQVTTCVWPQLSRQSKFRLPGRSSLFTFCDYIISHALLYTCITLCDEMLNSIKTYMNHLFSFG